MPMSLYLIWKLSCKFVVCYSPTAENRVCGSLLWNVTTAHAMPVSLFHYEVFALRIHSTYEYTVGGSHRSVGPSNVIEVKAKSFLCSPWRHIGGGGGGVVTVVIQLGTRRERVVSFTSRSLYSQGKRPRCPLNSWMVDHRAGLAFYLLTPCSRVLEKLTGFQLVKKFLSFYGTRRFITAFAGARHLSLSWASSI